MKKTHFFFLALAVIACISCGGRRDRPWGGGTVQATSDLNFTGYPMDMMGERITWADLDGENLATRISSASQSPFHVNYSAMAGITIDWIFPTIGTPPAQMLSRIMADRVLPYIINGGGGIDAEQLITEGVMWDLTPYIEEWAPNYFAFLQTRPERGRAVRTDSGKYWNFGFFREDGPFMDTWIGPMIRKDWLDEHNLPLPQTIADWDRILELFKAEYGSVMSFERFFANNVFFAGAFGAYATYNFDYFVKDGVVYAANTQEEYRNYLAHLHNWFSRGLLDPDHLTMDNSTFFSRGMEGRFGTSYGALSRLTGLIHNSSGSSANWVGVAYPRGPDGTLTAVQGGWGIGNSAWISRSTPPDKLELVMRLLDYGFSEEGFLFTNFGIQGDTWDYNEAGDIIWLPKFLNDIDAPDYHQVAMKFVGQRGGQAGIQATRLVELINSPESFEAARTWFYPNEEQAYAWRMPPGVTMNMEESLRNAELGAPISTYVSEMAVRFVTGQLPLSGFDAFVDQLYRMGLAELLEIQQTVYDRWLGR